MSKIIYLGGREQGKHLSYGALKEVIMTKQLTPLEAFKRIKLCSIYDYDEIKEDTKIVETALKDYEHKTKLAKEYADVNNVAKRLKALEIIKNKRIAICSILNCKNATEYNKEVVYTGRNKITQEEFDLLKEVLK